MALAGLHVVFSYVQSDDSSAGALMSGIAGSSTITSGQTSTAAPGNRGGDGQPIAHLISAENGFFAVGKTPNAATDPRAYLSAFEPLDLFIQSGDKVAWLTA